MQATVRREVRSLEKKSTRLLKAQYEELFQEATRSNNRAYLMRRISWRLQANSEGELSEKARQRAVELADDANLRLRPPLRFYGEVGQATANTDRDPRLPAIGSLLRRSFRGRDLIVKVLADGFEFESQKYSSLSSIAHHITGTRWNGFTFFGLKAK